MTLAATVASRRYGQADRSFAEELACHAALALDNARLYRREQIARSEAEAIE